MAMTFLEKQLTGGNKYSGKAFKELKGTGKVKLGDIKIGKKFIEKALKDSPYSVGWASAFKEAQEQNPTLAPDYNYYQSYKPFKKIGQKLGIEKIDTVDELSDVISFAKAIGSKLYGSDQTTPEELEATQGYTGLKTTGAPAPGGFGSKKQSIEPEKLDVSGLTDDEGNPLGQVKPVEGPTIEELSNQLKILQDKIDNPTVDPLAKSFTETLKPAKFQQKNQTPKQLKLLSGGLSQYFGQQGLRIQSLLPPKK